MNNSRAPVILLLAIVLLLLPVLYVGSYLALVEPQGIYLVCMSGKPAVRSFVGHYRVDNRIATIFWPLEQIDRRLRPRVWEVLDLSHYGGGATQMELPDVTPA